MMPTQERLFFLERYSAFANINFSAPKSNQVKFILEKKGEGEEGKIVTLKL